MTNSIEKIQTKPADALQHLIPENAQDASNLNTECILSCILDVSPSADLALRYTQLNGFFREMAAPQVLNETGYLLADCRHAAPGSVPLPLVPQFASQRALMNASAQDVSWINLTWQLPQFYGLGQCLTVPITASQRDSLARILIQRINSSNTNPAEQADSATTIDSLVQAIKSASSGSSTTTNQADPKSVSKLLVIQAKAPVDTVSLHYHLPASDSKPRNTHIQTQTEYVHCRVFPLTQAMTADRGSDVTESFPFIGIPIVSYDILGPYSDADPIEAQLFSAAAQQSTSISGNLTR